MERKNILVLGVGGTGDAVVRSFEKRLRKTEYREKTGANIVSIVFDTAFPREKAYPVTEFSLDVGMRWERVRDYLGREVWGDAQAYDPMPFEGAVFTRREAYMAFLFVMMDDGTRETLDRALSRLCPDETGTVWVYLAASLAGSIGSGASLPLALYIKGRLRALFPFARIEACAFLMLPEVYDPRGENEQTSYGRFYSNAYAFFRELSAIEDAALEGKISGLCIGHKDTAVGVLFDAADARFHTPDARPFDRVCLKGRSSPCATIASHYEAMANEIYMLACTSMGHGFFSSPMTIPFSYSEMLEKHAKENAGGDALF